MPRSQRLCEALVMAGNEDEPLRCLAPVSRPSKHCCVVHLAESNASYRQYKDAAKRADELRVYAQQKCSAVKLLDPALVAFYSDGVRDYINAVDLELRLRTEHGTRFFLVVDEKHQQRLRKLERDLAHGRRLLQILETRRVSETASTTGRHGTRIKGRRGGNTARTNSPLPRVVNRRSRKKSKSTSKPTRRHAKVKAGQASHENESINKPDHGEGPLLSRHEDEMGSVYDAMLDQAGHHEDWAVGQACGLELAQSIVFWEMLNAAPNEPEMLDAKGKDGIVRGRPGLAQIFEDGITGDGSATIHPDAILLDVESTHEHPPLRELDDPPSVPSTTSHADLAAEPPRLPRSSSFASGPNALVCEARPSMQSYAAVLQALPATKRVEQDEPEPEDSASGVPSSTMASYTYGERVGVCVLGDLGDHQARQMRQRPGNAYVEPRVSAETVVDLRASAMDGCEDTAAPTGPFACNHDGPGYGCMINSRADRQVTRDIELNSGEDNEERGDDDGRRERRRWDSWEVFRAGGFALLVVIPFLAFRGWRSLRVLWNMVHRLVAISLGRVIVKEEVSEGES